MSQMTSTNTNKCVRVVVRITKPCFEPATEEVRIIATMLDKISPNWRLEETQLVNYIGFNQYFLEIGLPKNCVMRYKLMVLRVKDQHTMHVEDFERVLRLGHVPVMIQINYDDPEVRMRELKGWLTRTGSPVNISVRTPNLSTFKPTPRGWDMRGEDVPEEECHKVEYFSAGGRVNCRMRSPPKATKPDFSQDETEVQNVCLRKKHLKKTGEKTKKDEDKKSDKKKDGKKTDKDKEDVTKPVIEMKDKVIQVTNGRDRCTCKREPLCPEKVFGRFEKTCVVICRHEIVDTTADIPRKQNKVCTGNSKSFGKLDEMKLNEEKKFVDQDIGNGVERSEYGMVNGKNTVESPEFVFDRSEEIKITNGYQVDLNDEHVTLNSSRCDNNMEKTTNVITDVHAPANYNEIESHLVKPLDVNDNEVQEEVNMTDITEDMEETKEQYSFVKKCLKYALPVGVVGALGAYLWFRNK